MDITAKIILSIIVGLALTKVPVIGKYFAVANTLIHEVGHQIASILTFGKAHKIQLFANTEGLALSSHRFWAGKFITALAGYVFSSFTAYAFFWLIHGSYYNIVIYILLAILIFSLIFWVRNWYGFFWLITFTSCFVWLLLSAHPSIMEFVIVFIVSVIFVESITSAFEIMYLSFKKPSEAGDASSLAKLTFIVPAQIWGILFFIQSLYFGWLSLALFFPFLSFT